MNLSSNPHDTAEISAGEITWQVARLFPRQGHWNETDFLSLPQQNWLELTQGRVEDLPMPTWLHAEIVFYLARLLSDFVRQHSLGRAVPAPLFVRLWEGEIRQPDVVFCFHESIGDRRKVQNGADLAMEVMSEGKENRERDLITKRAIYAQAGIREYWIIDPQERTISVLALQEKEYRTVGVYGAGEQALSLLLPGFQTDVAAVFAAGEE